MMKGFQEHAAAPSELLVRVVGNPPSQGWGLYAYAPSELDQNQNYARQP